MAYHLEEYMDDNELDFNKVQRVEVSKPLKWTNYDSIKSEHVTHLVVQQHAGEFTLYFFEVQQPFTTGTPQEQALQLQELPYVEAKCIAKFIMSAPNAMEAEKVLKEQLDNLRNLLLGLSNEVRNV